MAILAALFFYSLIFTENVHLNSDTLTIRITNIEVVKGNMLIAVYDQSGGFPESGGELFGKSLKTDSKPTMEIEVPNLSYGQYAVAVFHDLNGNQKLDKNLMGIPVEPYGFSNNPKVKWRAPTFEDALFEFSQQQTKLTIELKRWKQQ